MASTGCSPGTRGTSSWSSTPRRSPRTTGRHRILRPTSRSTPTARSTCCRRRVPRPRRHVHLHLDEQGVRRSPEPPAAAGVATRLELPGVHRWYGGIGTEMSIDLTTHSLFGVSKAAADLLVQEYGRYFDMPTVCFRGGCLTGPQHAGRTVARLSRLSHEVHRHRRAVHDLRLRRQAGARQHPRTRRRARLRGVSRRSSRGRRLQPGRRARVERLDARGDRPMREIAAASSTTRSPSRPGSATTAGGSATSMLHGGLRRVASDLRHRGRSCVTSTSPTSSAGRWQGSTDRAVSLTALESGTVAASDFAIAVGDGGTLKRGVQPWHQPKMI